jgi:hypothetical protein
MDGCPLILPPPSKHSVMACEDCQEVARSALVKGIELKMATLIWHTALGYLWWNCTIFSLHVVGYAPPIDYNSCHNPST